MVLYKWVHQGSYQMWQRLLPILRDWVIISYTSWLLWLLKIFMYLFAIWIYFFLLFFFFDEFSLCLWLFYYSNVHIFLIELCRKCRTIILWKMRCLRNNEITSLHCFWVISIKALPFSPLWSSPNICFVLPDSNWYLLTWMPKHFKCLILSFNILN